MTDYAIKDRVTGEEIRSFRKKNKLDRKDLARILNVSCRTIESWENGKTVSGPIVFLLRILSEKPELLEYYELPRRKNKVRFLFMNGFDDILTSIDVDFMKRKVSIRNYTDSLDRAFGNIENPTYDDFMLFVESRCFPRTRYDMKVMLDELEIPFYDPLLIIEKTEGRMAEDDKWIKIEK
jgi:putative transcriptional regulator